MARELKVVEEPCTHDSVSRHGTHIRETVVERWSCAKCSVEFLPVKTAGRIRQWLAVRKLRRDLK